MSSLIPFQPLSFEEALRHYGESFRMEGIPFEQDQPHLVAMAAFCKVKIPTVMRWYRSGKYPVGDTRIRLHCFLELIGYQVEEYLQVNAHARQLGRLVCFGVIPSFEKVQEILGYVQPQSVYRVILRGEGLIGDRVRRMNIILREESPKLPDAQQAWCRESKVVRRLTEKFGFALNFVTLLDDELPHPEVPLTAARKSRSSTAGVESASKVTTRPQPEPIPTQSSPKAVVGLELPDKVTVSSEFALKALVATMVQLGGLLNILHESDAREALARALRKQYGPGLKEAIENVEFLLLQLQMLE